HTRASNAALRRAQASEDIARAARQPNRPQSALAAAASSNQEIFRALAQTLVVLGGDQTSPRNPELRFRAALALSFRDMHSSAEAAQARRRDQPIRPAGQSLPPAHTRVS